MIYTVKCRDRQKRRDTDSQTFNDRMRAVAYYKHLYEKYGENDRYDVSLDIGFGEEGEQGDGTDSNVQGGNPANGIGD